MKKFVILLNHWHHDSVTSEFEYLGTCSEEFKAEVEMELKRLHNIGWGAKLAKLDAEEGIFRYQYHQNAGKTTAERQEYFEQNKSIWEEYYSKYEQTLKELISQIEHQFLKKFCEKFGRHKIGYLEFHEEVEADFLTRNFENISANNQQEKQTVDYMLIERKIERIIEDNCTEIPYEGTNISKDRLRDEIVDLIKEIVTNE